MLFLVHLFELMLMAGKQVCFCLTEIHSYSSNKYFCRHEFYQKPEEVVVTIFAKGVPANSVSVDYGEQIV